LVYVDDANQPAVTVGQQVRDRALDIGQNPRFFHNFKRGIGTKVQGFLPELDGQVIRFEQVGQWFLQQVIQQLKATDPEVAQSLVFTVPVDSFEPYRAWLGQVATALEIEQVRLLDEPTAAALGYGLGDRDLLLVIDFGGGTLDLSLVQLDNTTRSTQPLGFVLKWGKKSFAEQSAQKPNIARVLAKAGQTLGGADIDQWLAENFATAQGITNSPVVTRLAERIKIQLSLQPEAQEVLFNDETFESYELKLTRTEFEQILREHGFFQRLDDAMSQVQQQARRQGLAIADVDAVLLVGGTAQIPSVRDWVRQYVDDSKIRSDKPFEAIAQGALQLSQGVELQDFLYHSYGIRYWNRRNNCHGWHPIIKAGQPYPMTEPVEITLGASVEQQPSIELIIGELGTEGAQTEVFFDGDRLVTRSLGSSPTVVQPLNDREGARQIAKLDPPGFPGSDRIRVQFRVDDQRLLRITVLDLLVMETVLEDHPVVQLS
jgi:molecular chaperone DnaK (HSP70)